MQYALVDGIRTKPAKGLKGICTGCKKDVTAKCGSVKIHHWAHNSLRDCDTWWEPETEWHLNWKDQFPEQYREITFFASNGEPHRADVHTSAGITFEFQNSPISIEELNSREQFYEKLIWVVNATKFKDRIEFLCNIPDPDGPLLKQYSFGGIGTYSVRKMENLMFLKLPDNPENTNELREVLNLNHPEMRELAEVCKATPPKYWLFKWKYKHTAWLNCSASVFFDFGDDILYWLKRRNHPQDPMLYFHAVSKRAFLKKYAS